MAQLNQAEINESCEAAYQQFAAMPPRQAALVFAYTLQGFAKYMTADCGETLPEVRRRVIELMDMLEAAQPHDPNPMKYPRIRR